MDVYGNALLDYYKKGRADILWLYNTYDEPEEMPLDIFFRSENEMPPLEHKALSTCHGKILDVGAGVGSHALVLQNLGLDVTAIDICENAVKIMHDRGLKNALHQDILAVSERYDTLLFLMNGIGLTGTIRGLTKFLEDVKSLINKGGQLIFDSSDISYLYEIAPSRSQSYFGEISFCYEYQSQRGEWFKWLYIDKEMLHKIAVKLGWDCEILFDDGNDQYLAKLTLAE